MLDGVVVERMVLELGSDGVRATRQRGVEVVVRFALARRYWELEVVGVGGLVCGLGADVFGNVVSAVQNRWGLKNRVRHTLGLRHFRGISGDLLQTSIGP